MRILLAIIHLLGMAIGVGSIFARARAADRFRKAASPDRLRAILGADNWWAVSAALLIGTGLWRALAGMEKSPSYYWGSQVFWGKMFLLATILALEVWPMVTLIRWRTARGRGTLDVNSLTGPARAIARISDVQLLLLVGLIAAATLLARGYFA